MTIYSIAKTQEHWTVYADERAVLWFDSESSAVQTAEQANRLLDSARQQESRLIARFGRSRLAQVAVFK